MESENFIKNVLRRANLENLEENFTEQDVDKNALIHMINGASGSREERFFTELVPRLGERVRILEAVRFYQDLEENDIQGVNFEIEEVNGQEICNHGTNLKIDKQISDIVELFNEQKVADKSISSEKTINSEAKNEAAEKPGSSRTLFDSKLTENKKSVSEGSALGKNNANKDTDNRRIRDDIHIRAMMAKWAEDRKNKEKQDAEDKILEEKIKKGAKIGAIAVATGAVAGIAAVALAPIALAGVGFGTAGVAAGSIAAGVQSIIGNVAAGSIFASLTSAGAAGLAATTTTAIGVTAGGVAAAGAAAVATAATSSQTDAKQNQNKLKLHATVAAAATSQTDAKQKRKKLRFKTLAKIILALLKLRRRRLRSINNLNNLN